MPWKPPKLNELPIEHLDRLPQGGRDIDLMEFTRCAEFRYLDSNQDGFPNVVLGISSRVSEIGLLLGGVRAIRIPEVTGRLWFSEIEIVDIKDRMMEGIRFVVQSKNGDGLQCYCAAIECIQFDSLV